MVEEIKSKRYKLIRCDNPLSVGFNYIGLTKYLEIVSLEGEKEKDNAEGINGTKSLFFFGSLRSSLIKDIKVKEYAGVDKVSKLTKPTKLVIQTLNTEYIFEEVLDD